MARGPLKVGRQAEIYEQRQAHRAVRLAERATSHAFALATARALNELEVQAEVERLSRVLSTWQYVLVALERATQAPRTVVGAQGVVGPEFPVTASDQKPRDSEENQQAVSRIEGIRLASLMGAPEDE